MLNYAKLTVQSFASSKLVKCENYTYT